MPHYHLNLYNDVVTMDDDGRDFPDLAAAKAEAIQTVRDLIAEHVRAAKPVDLSHRIEITDTAGKLLVTIPFGELITIKDSHAAN